MTTICVLLLVFLLGYGVGFLHFARSKIPDGGDT